MPLEHLSCPRCGAPLQVTANNPLATCDYCKSTIRITTNQPNELYSINKNIQFTLPKPEESPWFEEIFDSLTRLLNCKESDQRTAFVVFYERKSKKFVQFAYPLILDLPFNPLSEGDKERAKVLFYNLGVSDPYSEDLYADKSLKGVVSKRIFYKYDFGKDVLQATQITLAIFKQVYQFPINFDLDYDEE